MKKGLSLLLSLLMVISMFSCLTVVASAASDYQLDVLHTVSSEDEGVFVVEEAGNYVFSSYGEGDPQITIYDSVGDCITEFDDDVGRDFQGVVYLEAGEYTLKFHNYHGYGYPINFKIEILNMDITSASITLAKPFELVEEIGGYWSQRYVENTNEYEDYYHYYYSVVNNDGDTITLTFGDGTSKAYVYDSSINVWEAADGSRLVSSLLGELTYQEYDPWLLGEENYMTLSYLGVEFYSPVTIIENPVASIAFSFVDYYYLIKESGGDWMNIYNDMGEIVSSYYCYNIPSANECLGNTITVTYTDGRVVSYTYTESCDEDGYLCNDWIAANGETLDLSQCDITTSSYQEETPWTVGGENLLTVEYMNKTTQVSMSVKENPVESIEFTPANPEDYTLFFEVDGRLNGEGFGEPYFHYYTPDLCEGDVLTVKYTDGSTIDYIYDEGYWYGEDNYQKNGWFSENGEEIDESKTYVHFYNNQEDTHWTLGSDNYITVEYMFKEYKIPVTIIENPVESIEFTPKTAYEFIENLDGYWDDRYNEETGEDEEYFYYQAQDIYNYDNALTVNYTDGSKKVFVFDYAYDEEYGDYRNGWFSADGYIGYFDVSYFESQYVKPWVVGGNNYITVEYMGRECQVPVTIKANPVESIEFIPANGGLSVFENTKGYWQGYWDEYTDDYIYTYYEYDFQEIVEQPGNAIKVKYTNGTTSTYCYSSFEDCWIDETDEILDYDYLGFWATQYEGNSWTIGNNSAKISYYGKETEVTVKVMEAIPDVTDGKFTAEVISETACHIIEIDESAVVNGVLTIPEAIDGYTVTGMDSWLFYEIPFVAEVNLPSGFVNFSSNTFDGCEELEKVNVAEDNKTFKSLNGVVYNKSMTEIVYCPPCFKGDLYIPAEVEEIDGSILAALGNASSITIDENNPNFAIENGIVYNADFTKIVKALSLPENYVMKSTVTEIGQYAFSGNTTVKTATINQTVTEISYGAFYGCSALESVAMPEGIVSIGLSAFKDSGLKSVTLPSTVEYIDDQAFEDCRALTSATLNEGLTDICSFAFENTGLTSVVIPDSVTWIGYKAFYDCDSLTNVVIGSGVGELTSSNFADCDSLKEFNVPATVEQVSASVIRDCSSLEKINVDSNNPNYSSIDGVLFDKPAEYLLTYPDGKAGAYTVPSSVIDIQGAAFDNASKLASVVIPNSVTYINSNTFINCTALNNVVLSENITDIDSYAFENCRSLTEINIPASVTWISGRAFLDCTALKAINVAEANNEYASQNGILYSKDKETLILAPYGIEGAVTIPQGTKYISAFNDCEKVTSIVLPEGVTSIGGSAFSGCTSLTDISIPDSVTEISYQAFSGCSSIKSIELPSKINSISWRLFEDCVGLEAIEIPVSVTNIDSYAFDNCVSLKDVYYTGTEEQWNNIEIGEGNEYLTNATIHFNSTMPEIDTTPTLKLIGDTWYYMAGNKVLTDYTGLVNYNNAWYYVANGVLDWGYTGLVAHGDGWYYVEYGTLNWDYTGLVYHNGAWYYVEYGTLNWNYTGLTYFCGEWYYVEYGVLNWNYTGLTYFCGEWYYVEYGVLNWNYTGLTYYNNAWYYVEYGVLNWNYTGLTYYNGAWYYVEYGVLNWNYTGLTYYNGAWYYVEYGVLNWNYTGLTYYNNAWYYVEYGVLNWNYTGLTCYYDTWYYVANGVLDWGYTGYVNHNGGWYYITGGVLDWSKQ